MGHMYISGDFAINDMSSLRSDPTAASDTWRCELKLRWKCLLSEACNDDCSGIGRGTWNFVIVYRSFLGLLLDSNDGIPDPARLSKLAHCFLERIINVIKHHLVKNAKLVMKIHMLRIINAISKRIWRTEHTRKWVDSESQKRETKVIVWTEFWPHQEHILPVPNEIDWVIDSLVPYSENVINFRIESTFKHMSYADQQWICLQFLYLCLSGHFLTLIGRSNYYNWMLVAYVKTNPSMTAVSGSDWQTHFLTHVFGIAIRSVLLFDVNLMIWTDTINGSLKNIDFCSYFVSTTHW